MMPAFIPGLTLAERFYHEAVRLILTELFPQVPHSAALIGDGSEVLGFDTPLSADHNWGPRAMLFLHEADHTRHAASIREALAHRLPTSFLEWPTNFSDPDPTDNGVQHLQSISDGPINHLVDVLTIEAFFRDHLGIDVRGSLSARAWLTLPSQKLRSVTAGAVFHDEIGLESVRGRFAWYPEDVWLHLLAAGWTRIGQEEHLMGRAGQVGDEIGSALIAARLVRDVMRLCFLVERQYAPYPKWFGTAFAQLEAASTLQPLLVSVLRAETWQARDRALAEAYEVVAQQHNALGITKPLSSTPRSFFGRPFSVIFGDRFAEAIKACIIDPEVRAIPLDIGGVDQWSDSTDLLETTALRPRLETLYQALHEA